MSLETLVAELGTLAGFGALVALIVNVLKTFKLVSDGQAPVWSTGLNILLLAGLFALNVYRPDIDPGQYDPIAAQLAQLGAMLLALFTQLGGARIAHNLLRGIPVVGKSYSR